MALDKKVSYSGQESISGLSGGLSFETGKNRIIGRDSDNISRLVILANENDFFFKVSKPGIDVNIADDDELIFNSGQNVFKIVDTNVITAPIGSVTAGGTGVWNNNIGSPAATKSRDHNLGYIPAVIAYIENNSTYFPMPYRTTGNSGPGQVVFTEIKTYVDATKIYFTTEILSLNTTISFGSGLNIRYYLLQETAN